jgi:hypothetical protein
MRCPNNCAKCNNNGVCNLCENNYVLVLGTCIQQTNDTSVKSLAQTSGAVVNNTISNPITDLINKNSAIKTMMNAAFGFLVSIDDLWIFSYH